MPGHPRSGPSWWDDIGVSAGIDGSLHLVGRLLGTESAAATAYYMEYDWTPSEK